MTGTTFITDNKGKRISAVLPMKKYEQLLSDAEDLEDIKSFDRAMSRKQEFIPLEKALKELSLSRKKIK